MGSSGSWWHDEEERQHSFRLSVRSKHRHLEGIAAGLKRLQEVEDSMTTKFDVGVQVECTGQNGAKMLGIVIADNGITVSVRCQEQSSSPASGNLVFTYYQGSIYKFERAKVRKVELSEGDLVECTGEISGCTVRGAVIRATAAHVTIKTIAEYVGQNSRAAVGSELAFRRAYTKLLAKKGNWIVPQPAAPAKPAPTEAERVASEAKKKASKAKVRLLPGKALLAMATILTDGAEKYAEDSWKHAPFNEDSYKDAVGRHYFAILDGEDYDDDVETGSGCLHAAHLATSAMMLLWHTLKRAALRKVGWKKAT